MDDQVRRELTDLLRTGGRNLCTMPQTLATLLHRRCPEATEVVADVEQALNLGCVRPLLDAAGPPNLDELADSLASESGMAPDRAQWVIETWAEALGTADTPLSPGRNWSAWNRLDVKAAGGGAYQQAVRNLIVVGAAGGIGEAAMGFFLALSGEAARVGPLEVLEDASPWLQTGTLLTLGLLGGLAGAVIGWVGVGGRSAAHDTIGGTTPGRLMLSAFAAAIGAGVGALVGLAVLGPIGVMLGALVAAVVGLIVAELLLRIWP